DSARCAVLGYQQGRNQEPGEHEEERDPDLAPPEKRRKLRMVRYHEGDSERAETIQRRLMSHETSPLRRHGQHAEVGECDSCRLACHPWKYGAEQESRRISRGARQLSQVSPRLSFEPDVS